MFVCSNCGYGSASWMGRCPDCNNWNTFTENRLLKEEGGNKIIIKGNLTPLMKISPLAKNRKKTGYYEFDRVLGQGLVAGEVILLTGEPGVGKSTLLLQMFASFKTVYVSGEESAEQVKDRAQRLKIDLKNFLFSDNLQIEGLIESLEETKNIDALVIDSIQTIYSKDIEASPGNINQLKETAMKLVSYAKKNKVIVVIIGHITKEGEIAGPKSLEHIVDCVINFEGEKMSNFRLLRSQKNRFGPTDEIGIFEMKEQGLVEISNPMIFITNENESQVGRSVIGITEGKRTLFFEIQTLTVPSFLAVPRRVVKGMDYNKVQLLLAVARKYLNMQLDKLDVYVNVVGGVDIKSTAADLGLIASLISSVKNIPLSKKHLFVGEVGLLGEIRKVFSEEKIINEAKRLGFHKIYSSSQIKNIRQIKNIL